MRLLRSIVCHAGFAALLASAIAASGGSTGLQIRLKHDSPAEQQTAQQLERLASSYGLTRWYFSREIEIDERAIPHSHPVLTLHTRHLKDDDLLLSSFVHEEIHWFLGDQKELKAAEDELRVIFPTVPVGFPDGADSEESGDLHLLVNFLEWRSDEELLGDLRARAVMEFWTRDHYRVLYQMVLNHPREIGAIIAKHHLDVAAASPPE